MSVVNFGKVAGNGNNNPRESGDGSNQHVQLSNGKIVHVWFDDGYRTSGGHTAADSVVYGRIFNADGSPDGSKFVVSQWTGAATDYTQSRFSNIAVAESADGGFNVFWQSSGQSTMTDPDPLRPSNTYTTDVMARQFNANGTAKGNEIYVEDFTYHGFFNRVEKAYGGGENTHTMLLSNGNTVLSWEEDNNATGYTEWKSMILDEDLQPVHDETGQFSTEDRYFHGWDDNNLSDGVDDSVAAHDFSNIENIEAQVMADGRILYTGQGKKHVGSEWDEAETYAWILDTNTNTLVSGPTQTSPSGTSAEHYSAGTSYDPSTDTYAVFSITTDKKLYRTNLDADGNVVDSPTVIATLDTPGVGSDHYFQMYTTNVKIDGDGNVVVMYTTHKSGPHTGTIFSKVIDADGTVNAAVQQFQSDGMGHPWEGELSQLDDGTFFYGFSAGTGQTGVHHRWGGTFDVEGSGTPPVTPGGPDGIVSGTGNDDVIDAGYTGDPDGDRVDNNDAIEPVVAPNRVGTDDDTIDAGAGNDTVRAGDGHDTVMGGTGNDDIEGGSGNDDLRGEDGDDTIDGGTGNDTITGGDGEDIIDGGDGVDTIDGGDDDDTIDGGKGDDIIDGGKGNDTIDGGNNNDTIDGGKGEDTILGGSGNDDIDGGDDNDDIDGGTGNDDILGGKGDDILKGGDGDDDLRGEQGDDDVQGGDGDDTIHIHGSGEDTIDGGADNDTIRADVTTPGETITVVVDDSGDGTLDKDSSGDTDTFTSIENFVAAEDSDEADEITLSEVVTDRSTVSGLSDNSVGTYTPEGGGAPIAFGPGEALQLSDILADTTKGGVVQITDGDESGTVGNISFENFETINFTLQGPTSDGIVSGTGNDDVIDAGYTGDPDGDLVDNNDAKEPVVSSGRVGTDDDTIMAGGGNDTVRAGDGHDIVHGGTGNDDIDGGDNNDTLHGEDGDDTIDGGRGHDDIFGGDGDDTIVMNNSFGRDEIEGGEGGETDGDVLDASGMTQNVTVDLTHGGTDNDPESGRIKVNNTHKSTFTEIEKIITGSGDDRIIGSEGDDHVETGAGADTITGGGGDDTFDAGAGNDTIDGGAGNDTIDGGSGDDTIDGGTGDDTIILGSGTDDITGGDGRDTLDANGDLDEVITVSVDDIGDGTLAKTNDGTTDTLDGIEHFIADETAGDDEITLTTDVTDRSTIQNLDTTGVTGVFTPSDSSKPAVSFGGPGEPTLQDILNNSNANGRITVTGGDESAQIGNISFENFEVINFNIICFARGTKILTNQGEMTVEELTPGVMVMTQDSGYQPLRWIGSRTVPAHGKFAPVRIQKGQLGATDDLLISQQHRVLVKGLAPEVMFGEHEVLVPAKGLINGTTVTLETGGEVEYFHMLFDQHEIVFSNGLATESFHPAHVGVGGLAEETRAEVFELFPELKTDLSSYGKTAKPCLSVQETKIFAHGL